MKLTIRSITRTIFTGIRRISTMSIVLFVILTATAQDKYKTDPAPAHQDLKFKTDLEFAKLLDKDWLKMEILPGLAADETPKPVDIPVADVTEEDLENLEETFRRSQPVKPAPIPEPAPLPEPQEPPTLPEPEKPLNVRTTTLDFFEAEVEISYDPDLWVPVGSSANNRTISAFWETISRANYDDILAQAKYYKNQMILNDWGYGLLLVEIGKSLYPNSQNGAVLFSWFMMVKSGYDARIGYGDNRVYLLFPSTSVWYETPYFQIEGKTYYLASFGEDTEHVKSLFIYQEAYPGAEAEVDLNIARAPAIHQVAATKSLEFQYMGQPYPLSVEYDKSLVGFFTHYPQTDLPVYFDASVSNEARRSLLEALKPIIAGKSEAEAVNIILIFVQTAFEYQTDGEQFGREKYFFPEETLYYAYSDCEDRSILFAYLVRNLTRLEVIGLDYPGHVATAVKFSDNLPGDGVFHDNSRYLICDPTYIHATIGMCMPQYKDTAPTIVSIGA